MEGKLNCLWRYLKYTQGTHTNEIMQSLYLSRWWAPPTHLPAAMHQAVPRSRPCSAHCQTTVYPSGLYGHSSKAAHPIAMGRGGTRLCSLTPSSARAATEDVTSCKSNKGAAHRMYTCANQR